ncbi:hypothetical protein Mic7113_4603 [Allocoleopsis franciscana PCC 7113]|uniref:Uncharacterized protein n=1 Tax=Allocoleopsis franciscana PCC 7113 TaxID=1173027 RepID=K9WKI1_9CYAN|nr:hypothetical protein Mic7113_4603 [Allocoleopsis franciscana PCC 7113]
MMRIEVGENIVAEMLGSAESIDDKKRVLSSSFLQGGENFSGKNQSNCHYFL